jgi:hypothetical protein
VVDDTGVGVKLAALDETEAAPYASTHEHANA